MRQIFSQLEMILTEETRLYSDIYSLEKDKTMAVIEKNGGQIQDISSSQEKLVLQVEALESERFRVISRLAEVKGLNPDASLTELVCGFDDEFSERIKRCGAELKRILLGLREKQDANRKLINDNIEFFDILISDLRNSSSLKSGYGSDGKENVRIVNPVLFNTKV